MKMRKTTAFYIEALCITLFLFASAVVLLQMFSTSRGISMQARSKTDAVIIAQNATEQFSSLLKKGSLPEEAAEKMNGKSVDGSFEIGYSADGLLAAEGEYSARLSAKSESADIGAVYTINVEVFGKKDNTKPIFSLNTKCFANSRLR